MPFFIPGVPGRREPCLGRGGMALGATVLNVVTIGPAFLVGGLVVKGQGAKEITKAREREADIAVAIAELDETGPGSKASTPGR